MFIFLIQWFYIRNWAIYSFAPSYHTPPLLVLLYVVLLCVGHILLVDVWAALLPSFWLGLANEDTERRERADEGIFGDIYFLPPVPSLLPWFDEWLCSLNPVVLKLEHIRITWVRCFWFSWMGQGLRICISNRFPGVADAAGVRTSFEKHSFQATVPRGAAGMLSWGSLCAPQIPSLPIPLLLPQV